MSRATYSFLIARNYTCPVAKRAETHRRGSTLDHQLQDLLNPPTVLHRTGRLSSSESHQAHNSIHH